MLLKILIFILLIFIAFLDIILAIVYALKLCYDFFHLEYVPRIFLFHDFDLLFHYISIRINLLKIEKYFEFQ